VYAYLSISIGRAEVNLQISVGQQPHQSIGTDWWC